MFCIKIKDCGFVIKDCGFVKIKYSGFVIVLTVQERTRNYFISVLNCTFSQKLWSNTQNWCSPIFKLPNLSEKIVFLGYLNEETNNTLISHIILLYKYFLYSKRDNPGGTNFKAFKAFIRHINKTERFIAKK